MSIGAVEIILLMVVMGFFLLGTVIAGGFLAYRLSHRRTGQEAGSPQR